MHTKNLSKNEIDAIKIVLAILEGHDSLNYISRFTKLPKLRIKYLLESLEKAGLIYKKEGTKQWRVRVDYLRVLKNAEYIYYIKKEKVTDELEPIKEL
jgi:hypothetical protein